MELPNLPQKVLIDSLVKLGQNLAILSESDHEIKYKAQDQNPWFTLMSINQSLKAWSNSLKKEKIEQWLTQYQITENLNITTRIQRPMQTIGLILAGNIPMVGFHDILCCLASGDRAQVKLSTQDSILIPFLVKSYQGEVPIFDRVDFVERLHNFDGVIATGSNNSARYFEYYFGKYPHIIRKNRSSLAILTGLESDFELEELGQDIFNYFGLGCRNVSKLLVPENYDFTRLLNLLEKFKEVATHHKYMNNVEYQNALLMMNQIPFLQNGFLYIKESTELSSPISVVYFEYFNPTTLSDLINPIVDSIQCLVANKKCLEKIGILEKNISKNLISFGQSQIPELWDYADEVDTMKFLLNMNE